MLEPVPPHEGSSEGTDPFLSLRRGEEEERLKELLAHLDGIGELFQRFFALAEENEGLKRMVQELTLALERKEEENLRLKREARNLGERLSRILYEMERHVQRSS